jgi:hypothetical protein
MKHEDIIRGFLNNTASVNERAMYLSLMYEQNELVSRSIDFFVVMVIRAFQADESGELLIEILSDLRSRILGKILAEECDSPLN